MKKFWERASAFTHRRSRFFRIHELFVTTAILTVLGAALLVTGVSLPRYDVRTEPSINVGSGFLVAAAIGLIIGLVKKFSRDQLQIQFQEFFGAGSLDPTQPGCIVLEAIRIDRIMENLFRPKTDDSILPAQDSWILSEIKQRLKNPAANRFYKAGTWINAQDALGAKTFREEMRGQGFPLPELLLIPPPCPEADAATAAAEQDSRIIQEQSKAPYLISMGLGWTSETKVILEKTQGSSPVIRIDVDPKGYGDVIISKKSVDIEKFTSLLEDKDWSDKGWSMVVPCEWERDRWLAGDGDSKDYALIIRHFDTETDHHQVQFVVAGFTEDGTAQAAKYLAKHWSYLWRQYVKGNSPEKSDFAIVIAGMSKSAKIWRQRPAISVQPASTSS